MAYPQHNNFVLWFLAWAGNVANLRMCLNIKLMLPKQCTSGLTEFWFVSCRHQATKTNLWQYVVNDFIYHWLNIFLSWESYVNHICKFIDNSKHSRMHKDIKILSIIFCKHFIFILADTNFCKMWLHILKYW